MTSAEPNRRLRMLLVLSGVLAVVVAIGAALVWVAPSRYLPWDTADFPPIESSALSSQQVRILKLLAVEHEAGRPGTYYSEGVDEQWCADFVSWIMKESGRPLSNLNSGSWRIPGVYTLQEYYQGIDAYAENDGSYTPEVGDVVIYDSTRWIGQHTNFIVSVDGDTAVTVGGNESGKVRVHSLDWTSDSAVVGFGKSGLRWE
ncbi:hypothetical protein ABH922_004222 [Rhodococcus sp. 27YEA15]|uniref:CHAP domain-containing protein n=1 Tax=Rhodococcus sp. 27YEA15 TaxID=3156259 RepID=UPI003C7C0BC8